MRPPGLRVPKKHTGRLWVFRHHTQNEIAVGSLCESWKILSLWFLITGKFKSLSEMFRSSGSLCRETCMGTDREFTGPRSLPTGLEGSRSSGSSTVWRGTEAVTGSGVTRSSSEYERNSEDGPPVYTEPAMTDIWQRTGVTLTPSRSPPPGHSARPPFRPRGSRGSAPPSGT